MWRLNAFWCVILPVPVTLKRFFALELVLTFGIICSICDDTLEADLHWQNTWWGLFRQYDQAFARFPDPVRNRGAKIAIFYLSVKKMPIMHKLKTMQTTLSNETR
jgi:hypothetical protein